MLAHTGTICPSFVCFSPGFGAEGSEGSSTTESGPDPRSDPVSDTPSGNTTSDRAPGTENTAGGLDLNVRAAKRKPTPKRGPKTGSAAPGSRPIGRSVHRRQTKPIRISKAAGSVKPALESSVDNAQEHSGHETVHGTGSSGPAFGGSDVGTKDTDSEAQANTVQLTPSADGSSHGGGNPSGSQPNDSIGAEFPTSQVNSSENALVFSAVDPGPVEAVPQSFNPPENQGSNSPPPAEKFGNRALQPDDRNKFGRRNRRGRGRGRDGRGVPGNFIPGARQHTGVRLDQVGAINLQTEATKSTPSIVPSPVLQMGNTPSPVRREAGAESAASTPPCSSGIRKVVLLNSVEPGEIRVAILENGELAEIFMERKSRSQLAGNIYKARVVNVEPSLQASFVDLGTERNGFLHASDCIPPDGGYIEILSRGSKEGTEKEQIVRHAEVSSSMPEHHENPVSAKPELTVSGSAQASGTPPIASGVSGPAIPRHNGKRRRRRGGRGRLGRVRPPGAAPMLASGAQPSEEAADPIQNNPTDNIVVAETAVVDGALSPPVVDGALSPVVEVNETGMDLPENSASDLSASIQNTEILSAVEQSVANEIPVETVSNAPAPIPAPGQPAPVLSAPSRKNSGRDGGRDRRYTIQEMLRVGQDVLVQVAKEGIGQKGPALTTYLSMPGRYLVLMPAVQRLGVSKRIENEDQRRALKDALNQLHPPDDMGIIVRTAGMGRSSDELKRDLTYLTRVWDTLKKKARMVKAPALIFQEADVVSRVFRDVITDDVAEIVIDDPVVLERAKEFLRETAPGSEHKLKLYSDAEPLFHKYGVEQQMQRLFNRKVNLRSGGSIVIEQTEALVAVDVNTGRFREKRNQDDTILQTNLEAAREIARQLRLRDIGGLVMIDFIDMEIGEHRRRVEREFKAFLARDKARINVLPISSLGVVEMTRQRIRHSLRKTLFDRCPHCSGAGHIKSGESMGLEMLREIKSQLKDSTVKRMKVLLNSTVAFDILNRFRKDLVRLEESKGVTIEVCGEPAVSLSQMHVSTAKEGGEWVLKKVSEVDDYVRNS